MRARRIDTTMDMLDDGTGYELRCPECGQVWRAPTVEVVVNGVMRCAYDDIRMRWLLDGEPGGAVPVGIRNAELGE